MKTSLLLILANVRSAQNVGAIFRTADALGASVWTAGITPHPPTKHDTRPPHVADRALHLIAKTALGAELTVPHLHFADVPAAVAAARYSNYTISALEQTENACNLFQYQPGQFMALVCGTEATGLTAAELALCDDAIEIPMLGSKESLNVAVAASIAAYELSRHVFTEQ